MCMGVIGIEVVFKGMKLMRSPESQRLLKPEPWYSLKEDREMRKREKFRPRRNDT